MPEQSLVVFGVLSSKYWLLRRHRKHLLSQILSSLYKHHLILAVQLSPYQVNDTYRNTHWLGISTINYLPPTPSSSLHHHPLYPDSDHSLSGLVTQGSFLLPVCPQTPPQPSLHLCKVTCVAQLPGSTLPAFSPIL